MIWQPRPGMKVSVNYKDKLMPCQGLNAEVVLAAIGPGPRNVKIKVELWPDSKEVFYESVPRGNLIEEKKCKKPTLNT